MGAGNNLESFSPKVSRPLESKQEGPLESCSPVVSSVQKKELEGHWGRWPAPGHPGVCQTLNQNPHLLTPRPVPVGKGDGLVPRWDRWQRKANDCPALPPPCSVTLGKSLPFSEPQYSPPKKDTITITLFWQGSLLTKIIRGKR